MFRWHSSLGKGGFDPSIDKKQKRVSFLNYSSHSLLCYARVMKHTHSLYTSDPFSQYTSSGALSSLYVRLTLFIELILFSYSHDAIPSGDPIVISTMLLYKNHHHFLYP